MNRRMVLWLMTAVLACLMATGAPEALAQAYPAKPIRKILTIGGGGETNARIVAEKMAELLGVPVLVESQSAAGGAVGASNVARAAPDGYTIMWGTSSAMVLRQFVVKDNPYDTLRDFTAIAQLGEATAAVVANISFPPNSLKELIEYARRNPGKVSYASTGTGTTHHLTGALIAQMTGIEMLHVPYKNAPQSVTDLIGGRIQLSLSTMSTFMPLIDGGKMKLIVINSGRRMPQYPNVATINELLPNFDRPPSWIGYFGPAGLPQAIVRRLADAIIRAANTPEVKARVESVGTMIDTAPPEQFAAFVRQSFESTAKLMKAIGIQPE